MTTVFDEAIVRYHDYTETQLRKCTNVSKWPVELAHKSTFQTDTGLVFLSVGFRRHLSTLQ